jgi:hypothetical protein
VIGRFGVCHAPNFGFPATPRYRVLVAVAT